MMQFSVNKVTILGTLGRDVEIRHTASGTAVTSFSVATESYIPAKDGKEARRDTTWINCVAWQKDAENISKHCHKGSKIYIQGRLQSRKAVINNIEQNIVEVVVEEFTPLHAGNKKIDGGNEAAQPTDTSSNTPVVIDSSDLPF